MRLAVTFHHAEFIAELDKQFAQFHVSQMVGLFLILLVRIHLQSYQSGCS